MKKIVLSTMAAALLYADNTELEALKAQMSQMTENMKMMQAKIDEIEVNKTVSQSEKSTSTSETKANVQNVVSGQAFKKNQSNLDLSVIMDTSFVSRSKKDEELAHMGLPEVAHGLIGAHLHEGQEHATYDASNGFNLNYVELGAMTTVDPYLDAAVFLHFFDGGVEVEEAYLTTRNLPYNFRLKGGKFLSDFGRHNNQHHHAWSFSDMPLVYEAFLGNHGIQETGAQLQWIAPTDQYLMFGVEALQGKNEMMFGQKALKNPFNEEETIASSSNQPSLLVGYAKTSLDFDNTTVLAGASIASGKSRLDHFEDEESPYAFAGDTTLYGVDLTFKHYFDSYSSLTWQSEWLYRDMDGTRFNSDPAAETLTPENMNKKQAGYYTQLLYAPDQSWRMGLKYDNIYKNEVNGERKSANMDQYTAMMEYHSSEFARYRLQYTHSNALFNEAQERQNLDSVIFSVNLALGRHNAHPF